jgi:hypothetical protein
MTFKNKVNESNSYGTMAQVILSPAMDAPAVIIGMAGLGAKAGYKLVSALQKCVKFAKEAVNYYDKIKLYGVKL